MAVLPDPWIDLQPLAPDDQAAGLRGLRIGKSGADQQPCRPKVAGGLILAALLCAATVFAGDRSRIVRAEFQRANPCPANGQKAGPCPGWQVDHIQPLCAGGKDAADNLQWLDTKSHKAKTKRDVAACFGRVHKP